MDQSAHSYQFWVHHLEGDLVFNQSSRHKAYYSFINSSSIRTIFCCLDFLAQSVLFHWLVMSASVHALRITRVGDVYGNLRENLVRWRLFMRYAWRATPVHGPSTSTRLVSITSTMATNLPFRGPLAHLAILPVSTNLWNGCKRPNNCHFSDETRVRYFKLGKSLLFCPDRLVLSAV